MKKLLTIALSIGCLIILSSTAHANNDAEKNNGSNTSTESTTNNTEDKDAKSTAAEPEKEPIKELTPIDEGGSIYLGYKPDSTNLNSVNKFNFIFYFIYKLKYDEDPNNAGQINYEF